MAGALCEAFSWGDRMRMMISHYRREWWLAEKSGKTLLYLNRRCFRRHGRTGIGLLSRLSVPSRQMRTDR